jgi:type VI secretion system secreted protein Hcp
LLKYFKPAFLGRVRLVAYLPLSDTVMRQIVELQLRRIRARIWDSYYARFEHDPDIVTAIAARGSTSREHSEPALSEVVVTKMTDVSSPKLMLESVAGKLDNKVTIKFTTTTKGKVETFLTYDLTDCGVSGYSLSSGGDMPTESISLNFTEISKTFTGMDPDIAGSPETVGYDLTQMKTI